MIKVVLFDLGGVVFRDIYSGGSKDFAATIGVSEAQVLSAYRATDVPEWPGGKVTDEERWQLFVDELGLPQAMVQRCAENFSVVFEPIPETTQLIKQLYLQDSFKLGVLSDQHPGAVKYLHQRYEDTMQLFDPALTFISSEVGLVKHEQDLKFFAYAVKHSGVAGSEILFVDDSEVNTKHAAEVGMATYFFDRRTRSITDLVSGLWAHLPPGPRLSNYNDKARG